MKPRNNGFSLIEVMVTVAIIGLVTAVALPQYSDYVLRGRLTEAYAAMATVQPNAEQYWANRRTYVDFDTLSGVFPAATTNFTYALSGASTSAYTVTATGRAKAAGFVYTIDQQGTRATPFAPTGWTTSTSCWVDRKSGQCSQ